MTDETSLEQVKLEIYRLQNIAQDLKRKKTRENLENAVTAFVDKYQSHEMTLEKFMAAIHDLHIENRLTDAD